MNQKSEYPKYLTPQKEQLLLRCLRAALLADAKEGGCVEDGVRAVRFESREQQFRVSPFPRSGEL